MSPGNGCASFNQTNLSPKVKITIKIKDQQLVDSKLLSVTINMNEVSSEKSNNMFFANYAQAISSPQTVIDTTSVEYQSSAASQQQENVYHQDLLQYPVAMDAIVELQLFDFLQLLWQVQQDFTHDRTTDCIGTSLQCGNIHLVIR